MSAHKCAQLFVLHNDAILIILRICDNFRCAHLCSDSKSYTFA